MIGKNVLWLAKQLGHSVQTMLTAYAAWVEGAKESDVEAIRVALEQTPKALLQQVQAGRSPLRSPRAVTRLSLGPRQEGVSKRMRSEMYGGKGGTRTLDPGIMSAVL
jgi:hypothetical protein